MKVIADICILLLLAGMCSVQSAAADAGRIRKMKVSRAGDRIRLELILSNPTNPRISIATSPDRLVLDLPGISANARERLIDVNKNGVIRVRIGLNGANPPRTRAVIDLDSVHPYELATVGNTVILTVLPLSPDKTEPPSDASLHVSFKIKYVAEGAAYLTGGRSSGLAVGMTLLVRNQGSPSTASATSQGPVVAELTIVSVAETSAVTEIHNPTRDVKPGDWAELSPADYSKLGMDPPKDAALRPPEPATAVQPGKLSQLEDALPDKGRIRARIAFDYSGISSSGSTPGRSSSLGMAFRTDTVQIAGTHWNLQGYWRGRLTTNSQPDEDTMQDYLDRTYTIQLSYDNSNSKWVAGFGRLYLPWAVSLDTIDGGYVGRRLANGITAGAFFGSAPDPASWHYRPNQQTSGGFVNFEGGSFDAFHYTSTTGIALDMLKWRLDRPYLFLENALSYLKFISVYHSFIVDSPQGISTDGIKPGAGISRSYLSLRVQPESWISFDISHNYFRDVPTATTALIGTGLVDKLLYQGVNGGVRVEPVRNLAVHASLGQSDKTGDARRSLNQMYGVTWNEIWHTGIRADIHYSKFDSSFARGDYRVFSLSRHLGNRMVWDFQAGNQTLDSVLTVNHRSVFIDTDFDTNLGCRTFLQSGYTIERGNQLNYEQWHLSLGYRFDVKGPVK